MKRTLLLLTLVACASVAQQPKPIVATSTFYDVDDANNRAFVEFSKNTTKKMAEALMKEDPAIRTATLSVRMYGGNPEPEGRYRFVIIREGFPTNNAERLAAVTQKATGMSYDDYLKKATSLRRTTGSSLQQRLASTSGDKPVGLAENDIIRTSLMKIMPDRAGDYVNMERNDWQPLHVEPMKSGAIKSWSLWAFRSPAGSSRAYDAITAAIYKDLDSAMANPGYGAIYQKLHPNGNVAALTDRARTVRTIVRSDLWRVIWSVSRQ